MSRKPSRRKPTAKAKPDPAQLKAIERLLEQEDYEAAIRRTRALVKQFPYHGGLRRSLVEALHAAEGPSAAGLAAFDWAEQRRNSLPAQEILLYYAAELYLPALAGRAARRVRHWHRGGRGHERAGRARVHRTWRRHGDRLPGGRTRLGRQGLARMKDGALVHRTIGAGAKQEHQQYDTGAGEASAGGIETTHTQTLACRPQPQH